MHTTNRIWAVVPAAGVGSRMAAKVAKQYLPLNQTRVIEHTLSKLLRVQRVSGIVVALAEQDPIWPTLNLVNHPKIVTTAGGQERSDSVVNGLQALLDRAQPNDWVLVHDAARPCVTVACIDRMIDELQNDPVGGLLAVPVADTLKRELAANGHSACIAHTVDRTGMWAAQTPQMFRIEPLLQALLGAMRKGHQVTDEASAMEHAGFNPRLITGRSDNIKITTPDDLALARLITASQAQEIT